MQTLSQFAEAAKALSDQELEASLAQYSRATHTGKFGEERAAILEIELTRRRKHRRP